jgi:hypothetical protein
MILKQYLAVFIALGLQCALLCCCKTEASAAEERFSIWQASGTFASTNKISPLYTSLTEPLKLDNGKTPYSADDPLLALRSNLVPGQETTGPWIQLTNGDIIPARIVRWLPAEQTAQQSLPARIEAVLEPAPNSAELISNTLLIHPDCIASYHFGASQPTQQVAGVIEYGAGRELKIRATQFRATGLECLIDKGVVTIPYDQLQTVVWPQRNTALDATRDGLWSKAETPLPGVVRFRTARGMILTTANQLIYRSKYEERLNSTFWIQPTWSVRALGLLTEKISWVSWRAEHQVPLSALKISNVSAANANKQWPWQRNRSVVGSELRVGQLLAEHGLGTHAGTVLSVPLPEQAQRLQAWVGINQSVGTGGCAKVLIRRDTVDGEVLWESDFLRGGQPATRINIELRGAKQLFLVVDPAHQNRPAGADPWDIRDHVDWLWPMILLNNDHLQTARQQFAESPGRWIPAMADFRLAEEFRKQVDLQPLWCRTDFRWGIIARETDQKLPGIRYSKQLSINYQNSHVVLAAAHDGTNRGRHHQLVMQWNGTELPATMNGNLSTGTKSATNDDYDNRVYSAAKLIGQTGELSIRFEPDQSRNGPQAGVIVNTLAMRPIIEDLDDTGKPLTPDIELTTIQPKILPEKATWKTGLTHHNRPLSIFQLEFSSGTGILKNTDYEFKLDPKWTEFVAVIGLAEGWFSVGPYTILLDGQPHWTSETKFDRNSPAKQIRVPIPAGHQTMTIRVAGRESLAGLGNAGFLTTSP